ncbi:hypothetical protein EMCRGX_G007452 [Ephydatia muelleri]
MGFQRSSIPNDTAMTEFTCKDLDFQPVQIRVPAVCQLMVFSSTYVSPSHFDNDVTIMKYLVKDNAIDHVGEMHTAIGDPEVGVPKTFRSVTAATRKGDNVIHKTVRIQFQYGSSSEKVLNAVAAANVFVQQNLEIAYISFPVVSISLM